MLTAGPITTTDDSAVTALADTSALGPRRDGRHIEVINRGTAPGFYSFDDGANWAFIPPETGVVKDGVTLGSTVRLKRVAGGSDLSDVYLSIW
ncbi:MAG: hypothetical protein WD534_12560 [Phycisphaeraceae bacterium]